MKINFQHIFSLFVVYLLLLAWNGYIYGHGDMIEVLPYAKWLNDSELYTKDFFIQNISASPINERFVLAYFYSWFGNGGMEFVSILLHFLCGMFLLEGLFRIGKMFIRSEGMIWVAILLPFTIFFGWNMGGNEMYIPFVSSSTVAKTIGIWVVYLFLKLREETTNGDFNWSREFLPFVLLSVATFIQPLVGLQLFLILFGIRVFIVIFYKKLEIKPFLPILFYISTGGVWIYILQSHFASGEIENQLLFEFFEFRLSHHFLPSYFSKKAAVLLLPIFGWSLFYFSKKNIQVFLFFVIALLGCLVYVVGVEFLEIPTVVSSQWFKTTIWLKSFSFIALFSFLEKKFSVFQRSISEAKKNWVWRIIAIGAVIIILFPFSIFKKRDYDFSFLPNKSINQEIDIAEIAKATTPKDAQFIIPISDTHFKNFSERSTYIDYKAVIHRKAIIPIWYERVQEIYGVNLEIRQSGQNIFSVADENYRNLKMEGLRNFSKKGIQYLLTFKEVELPLNVVGENKKYKIYQISED